MSKPTVTFLSDCTAIVVHPAGIGLAAAHAAARAIKGIRIIDTFVDGWGRTVTRAIQHGAR